MAATLRSDLAPGAPCPVCLRDVVEVPGGVPSVAVDAAAAAVTEAEEHRTRAEKARTAAAVRMAEAEGTLGAAGEATRRLEDELADVVRTIEPLDAEAGAAEARLSELLGDGDPAELVAARRRGHADLVSAAAEARRAVDQLRLRHDEAIRDQQVVDRRVQTLERELVGLASRLDVTIEIGEGDHGAVAAAVDRLRRAWDEHMDEAGEAMRRAAAEMATVAEERGALLEALEVVGGFAETLAADQRLAEHLAEEAVRDRTEIDASADVLEERDRLVAVKGRHDRISSDLTDSRFVRFLLDEERARLAALGSDHFMQLSSGRYRFTEDGQFDIVDLTAADAVRKAVSLSGGETFLASLALALALAEMVARTGGRLDAFFLDEGFGSLDPEHLDLAMEGIEALVAGESSRLVVVVSHVPELRHRIEDLIQLDRDPLTGDTRILRA
jgi:exonuclease SbcC